QRLGERSRFRIEAFDRQNEDRADLYSFASLTSPSALLKPSALFGRDYSRGVQFILQRRSENRLSGWIGYTLVFAKSRTYQVSLLIRACPSRRRSASVSISECLAPRLRRRPRRSPPRRIASSCARY